MDTSINGAGGSTDRTSKSIATQIVGFANTHVRKVRKFLVTVAVLVWTFNIGMSVGEVSSLDNAIKQKTGIPTPQWKQIQQDYETRFKAELEKVKAKNGL